MSDAADTEEPKPAEEPKAPAAGPIPGGGGDLINERPEVLVAGVFAGAFLAAKILRRIGGA